MRFLQRYAKLCKRGVRLYLPRTAPWLAATAVVIAFALFGSKKSSVKVILNGGSHLRSKTPLVPSYDPALWISMACNRSRCFVAEEKCFSGPSVSIADFAARASSARTSHNLYDWELDYPKPKQSRSFTCLLNDHVTRQKEICDGVRPVGAVVFYYELARYGLADGLRGVLFGYMLAVVTGRAFLIKSQNALPENAYFDLANHSNLLPCEQGTIDWRMRSCSPVADIIARAEGLHFNPMSPSPFPDTMTPVLDMDLSQSSLKCSTIRNIAAISKVPIILIRSNQGIECALALLNDINRKTGSEELQMLVHEPVFRTLFRRLFSFRSDTISQAAKYLEESSVDLSTSVCIHVRSGSFYWDKSDNFKPSIDINGSISCAVDIEKLLIGKGSFPTKTPMRWMVVSDDEHAKLRIAAAAGRLHPDQHRMIVDTGAANIGPVVHMRELSNKQSGFSAEKKKAAINRIMFDFYVLSSCRFLMAHKSGYAGLSAMLGEDWSKKKVFAAGKDLWQVADPLSYGNRTCRRHVPLAGQ